MISGAIARAQRLPEALVYTWADTGSARIEFAADGTLGRILVDGKPLAEP